MKTLLVVLCLFIFSNCAFADTVFDYNHPVPSQTQYAMDSINLRSIPESFDQIYLLLYQNGFRKQAVSYKRGYLTGKQVLNKLQIVHNKATNFYEDNFDLTFATECKCAELVGQFLIYYTDGVGAEAKAKFTPSLSNPLRMDVTPINNSTGSATGPACRNSVGLPQAGGVTQRLYTHIPTSGCPSGSDGVLWCDPITWQWKFKETQGANPRSGTLLKRGIF